MQHDRWRYYERGVRKKVGMAIRDYGMVRPKDRVIVAGSGGKDSLVLLKVLCDLRRAAPIDFEIVPLHIKTGFEDGFERVAAWADQALGLEIREVRTDIARILAEVSDPEKSVCALCSRLRRGHLYSLAHEMGAASIALGHTRDDIVETFLLRCLYTGQMGAMRPARVSNDGRNRVIRPLAYCPAELVERYFSFLEIAPVSNNCPIRSDGKRALVRGLLKDLEKDNPKARASLFAALGNIDMKSLCVREDRDAHTH
ncbi:MAG TPA: ATP-binding protein [Deltaproteobacteria bacterium]|nr:ATP-binding protein [Deltaproteobacteria bacterium]